MGKNNTKTKKIFAIALYIFIWLIGILDFYVFNTHQDAMGFSILYIYILLPSDSGNYGVFFQFIQEPYSYDWLFS